MLGRGFGGVSQVSLRALELAGLARCACQRKITLCDLVQAAARGPVVRFHDQDLTVFFVGVLTRRRHQTRSGEIIAGGQQQQVQLFCL